VLRVYTGIRYALVLTRGYAPGIRSQDTVVL
jgi:hypothetical protein